MKRVLVCVIPSTHNAPVSNPFIPICFLRVNVTKSGPSTITTTIVTITTTTTIVITINTTITITITITTTTTTITY